MTMFALVSLGCTVVGLCLLGYATFVWESPPTLIETVRDVEVGQRVSITGRITSLRLSHGHQFLSLHDPSGTITVVVFNSSPVNFSLHDSVCITGRVQHYPPQSTTPEIIYERFC